MSNVVQLRAESDRTQCVGETQQGKRCRWNAQPGLDLCKVHERIALGDKAETDAERSARSLTTAQKIEAAKQQVMDLVPVAMQAVTDILQDEMAKPADRIKAAQMILDRAVAQRIEVEQASSDVRDLDSEIEEALAEVREELATGTDG